MDDTESLRFRLVPHCKSGFRSTDALEKGNVQFAAFREDPNQKEEGMILILRIDGVICPVSFEIHHVSASVISL